MAPGDGPTGKAVVAQITTDGDFDAVINAQGRSGGGADDWQARGIAFSSPGGGGDTPPPPPSPPPTPPPTP